MLGHFGAPRSDLEPGALCFPSSLVKRLYVALTGVNSQSAIDMVRVRSLLSSFFDVLSSSKTCNA